MPTSPSPDSPVNDGPLLGHQSPNAYYVYNDRAGSWVVDWIFVVGLVILLPFGGCVLWYSSTTRCTCPHAVQPADCEVNE